MAKCGLVRMSGMKIEDEVYKKERKTESENDNERFLLIKNSAMLSNLSTFPRVLFTIPNYCC